MPLKHNDLREMIDPRISIDEYQPKSGIGDEIIVVAFFADDEGPAHDLDDFIEKGPYDIIDVDVSPNPDEEGHFLVFLEFKRQEDFWMKLDSVVEDVENLTGKLNWMVSSDGLDYECELSDPELRASVEVNPVDNAEHGTVPEVPEAALESYLQESLLLTLNRKDSIITIAGPNNRMSLELVDFGTDDTIIERQDLAAVGVSLLESSYEVRKLRTMLGNGWSVSKINDKIVINNTWTNDLLVTRYIE